MPRNLRAPKYSRVFAMVCVPERLQFARVWISLSRRLVSHAGLRFTAALAVTASVCFSAAGYGQAIEARGRVRPPDAHVYRDQVAIHAIEQAVESLGGKVSWQHVTAVRVQGQSVDKASKATPFVWTEELSERGLKTSGTFRSEKGTRHLVTTPDTHRKATVRGKEVEIPEMDPLAVISRHVPGMALARLLQDERYTLLTLTQSPVPMDRTADAAIWVRVFLHGGAQGIPVMDWKFDKATHLPLEVRRVMPMVGPIRFLIWDATEFDDFPAGRRGARSPASLRVSIDSGIKSSVQISNVELNPNLSANEFVGGEK